MMRRFMKASNSVLDENRPQKTTEKVTQDKKEEEAERQILALMNLAAGF